MNVSLIDYSFPVVLVGSYTVSWEGLSFTWNFDIVQPVYFVVDDSSIYDSVEFTDFLNEVIINE